VRFFSLSSKEGRDEVEALDGSGRVYKGR